MDDILITPDGRPLGRMDPIFKGLRGIYETQIIQTKKNTLELNLVTDNLYSKNNEDELRYEILKRTGPEMQIKFNCLQSKLELYFIISVSSIFNCRTVLFLNLQ